MSPGPPTLPQEGSLLAGRYLLGRVLGKGAMGVVYDAQQTRLESRAAIKVLRPEILGEPGLVARFEREARIIARLNSRHIVRVIDVDITDTGLPFLVMEFLDGWDLAAELKARGPFTLERALEVIGQLCSGVDDAHRAGVVHRDLKPSNIFLVANNELGAAPGSRSVKIVDFGVSKLVGADSDMTATASTLGTPRYMSPEQIRSSKNVDGRSDVWAIGTIFFELLAGRTPFQGESATGVAAAIVTEEPFPLRRVRPDIPEWVEKLIAGSLVKDPDRRIGTAAAFRAALDQGSTWTTPNQPLAVPPPAPPPQAPPAAPPPQFFQQPGVQAQVATQSSWANAEPVMPRASKAPLIAIFVGVFVVFGGALVLFLFLASGSHHSTTAETSTASPTTTSAPATPSPPATTAPHATESATALGPSTSAAPSASATATSTPTATPTPTPTAQTAAPPPPPPTHDAPTAVAPPPPPQPKDCPASRKILVGGKLTCP